MDRFDSVVIISGNPNAMEIFDTRIKKANKKTIVWMAGPQQHPGHGASAARYTAATKGAVRRIRRFERKTDAVVVPAGVVFHDLTTRPPEGVARPDFLWHPDSSRLNELGTLVSAWMLYAILTGESPVGVNFDMPPHIVGQSLSNNPDMRLTRELRRTLQQRVWNVARAWQAGRTHLD